MISHCIRSPVQEQQLSSAPRSSGVVQLVEAKYIAGDNFNSLISKGKDHQDVAELPPAPHGAEKMFVPSSQNS